MICNASDTYKLAIRSKLTFKESIDLCKNKLKSIVPFQEDREHFLRHVAWHRNITKGACSYIWTPDEYSEGTFLNMNSLSEAQPQFWAKKEPNGGKNENSVAIRVSTASLVDATQTSLKCSSCLISSSLLLQLDCRCRHSLIGKVIATIFYLIFRSILDKRYKILNVQSFIGFNGWENMYIRCVHVSLLVVCR